MQLNERFTANHQIVPGQNCLFGHRLSSTGDEEQFFPPCAGTGFVQFRVLRRFS